MGVHRSKAKKLTSRSRENMSSVLNLPILWTGRRRRGRKGERRRRWWGVGVPAAALERGSPHTINPAGIFQALKPLGCDSGVALASSEV